MKKGKLKATTSLQVPRVPSENQYLQNIYFPDEQILPQVKLPAAVLHEKRKQASLVQKKTSKYVNKAVNAK